MDNRSGIWQLEVEDCPEFGGGQRVHDLTDDPLTIGRIGGGCDISLNDKRVSRRHLAVELSAGGLVCRDLGSTHGVLINGARIQGQHKLRSGDVISIGNSRVVVRSRDVMAVDHAEPVVLPQGHTVDQPMLVRFYEDDAQDFKQVVFDEILSRLKLGGEVAGSRIKDAKFRENVTTMLDAVLDERWYQAPGDLDRLQLRRMLLDDLLELGPITPLIKDDTISEIMVNGPLRVFIEREGRLEETQCRFMNDAHVMTVIHRIVEPLGRRIDESSPRVDARLSDGSRVNAIIPPLTLEGPALTIRKFATNRMTGEELLKFGSVTDNMLVFLREVVRSRKNVLVSGGTGSGKTTLLNLLSDYIPSGERLVTVEDSAELQLAHRNLVRLEARPPNMEGKGEVTIRDLVINCLRMRPDRIVVGECRGKEAFDMLQAMNTGHDGSLTTIHANSPRDALLRLENMVMMAGFEMPVLSIREHISSAIDIVVQQARLADGSRKVTRISEVMGREGDVITMQDIFCYKQTGIVRKDNQIRVEGRFEATGNIPGFVEDLRAAGDLHLDMEIFRRQEGGGGTAMTVFTVLFVQIATFGAVVLLGVWVFRLLLEHRTGFPQASGSSRWVGALCACVTVVSMCIAMGQTDFLVLAPSVVIIGFLALRLPVWLLQRRQRQRAAAFRKGLVELTVGLSNGLRGGGALGQTLAHVARDLRGVVGEEVDRLLDEHRVGVEFAECFERLQTRMPSEDMTLLATAIRLTLSTGGSLAEVLDKMTTMMRERHEFDERLRTMTAQGRFEALAMGLAPLAAFGILFLIDRSMVEPLYRTVVGRVAMGAVLFLELIGFHFINKIVTIEV